MSEAREVFSRIYQADHWRGGSGEGSTAVASAPYREVVRRLVGARDVRSVVDIGCGDYPGRRCTELAPPGSRRGTFPSPVAQRTEGWRNSAAAHSA